MGAIGSDPFAEASSRFACLDIEGSGFPPARSYPIKISLALVDTGAVTSWLVTPSAKWQAKLDWDPSTALEHGISLPALLTNGRPIAEVRTELAATVAGHVVLSDTPGYDQHWLRRLYGGALPFAVQYIDVVIDDLIARSKLDPAIAYGAAVTAADSRFPLINSASQNARWWAEIIRALKGIT